MKKWTFVSIAVSFVLALTACGSSQNANAAESASTALSLEGQLLVGTIKLESTSLAISADQANQLLPFWETLQSLESSGTAASQEIEAVVSQIESSMNAEQISSITAMKLSQQDLAAAIADTGVSATTSDSANTTSASPAQLPAGVGAPGGGIPPSAMGGGMPSSMDAQAGITQAVTGQSTGTTYQVPPALINSLVDLLKKKIG